MSSSRSRRDLHVAREIRNVFAHSRGEVSFSDQSIKDTCGGRGQVLRTPGRGRARRRLAQMPELDEAIHKALAVELHQVETIRNLAILISSWPGDRTIRLLDGGTGIPGSGGLTAFD